MMKFLLLLVISCSAVAGPLTDELYCGEPKRNASGDIVRRADVLREFQKIHPCPSTGLTTGACPGWAKNHSRPLACGGCDSVSNLQWIPNDIKSCAGSHCIDRFERKIYDIGITGTDACTNEIVK